jgi:outer membrane murein-binding lipoprotein Lpp
MKTVAAALLAGLIAAGGAGAYSAAVTPGQVSALQRQVTALRRKVNSLQAEVKAQRDESDGLLGRTSQLENEVSTLQGSDGTVSCLRDAWNGLALFEPDYFASNSLKYNASTFGTITNNWILASPKPSTHSC